MDELDLAAEREGAATRQASFFRPSYAVRPRKIVTSRKGVNNVFGGDGGENRHANASGPKQIPTRMLVTR